MKHWMFLFVLSGAVLSTNLSALTTAEQCEATLHVESIRAMSRDELSRRRQEILQQYPTPAAEAICESSTALTYNVYKQHMERATRESQKAGVVEYDPAELYFFLECGEDQVNLSPLAYHAFNLNRDEYGFLGEMTLAIVWMSIGYLDIKDPEYDRSFMDAVSRILTSVRNREVETEIEMYEDLLDQIEGFREDYSVTVEECR
jgi:hypothetical protein